MIFLPPRKMSSLLPWPFHPVKAATRKILPVTAGAMSLTTTKTMPSAPWSGKTPHLSPPHRVLLTTGGMRMRLHRRYSRRHREEDLSTLPARTDLFAKGSSHSLLCPLSPSARNTCLLTLLVSQAFALSTSTSLLLYLSLNLPLSLYLSLSKSTSLSLPPCVCGLRRQLELTLQSITLF